MSKKISLAIWGLTVLLANVFLFVLQRGMTVTFWLTFAFIWISFISSLVFQLLIWKSAKSANRGLLYASPLIVSVVYEMMQIPLGIIFALCSGFISWKITLLVHTVILIVTWILILSGLFGNEHIERVNSRQKDHHKEL